MGFKEKDDTDNLQHFGREEELVRGLPFSTSGLAGGSRRTEWIRLQKREGERRCPDSSGASDGFLLVRKYI